MNNYQTILIEYQNVVSEAQNAKFDGELYTVLSGKAKILNEKIKQIDRSIGQSFNRCMIGNYISSSNS